MGLVRYLSKRLLSKRWWSGAWKRGARYYRAAYHDCLADRAVRIAQIGDAEQSCAALLDALTVTRAAHDELAADFDALRAELVSERQAREAAERALGVRGAA